jgi:ADP-heptose:LPS heptosyltransferase
MTERLKILCLRRGALGDTLLVLPILRALRAEMPSAELCFAGNLDFAVLFERYQVVDRVLSSEAFELWALASDGPPRQRAAARLLEYCWVVADGIDPAQLTEHDGLVQNLDPVLLPDVQLPAAQQFLMRWAKSLPERPQQLDWQPRLVPKRSPVGEQREVLIHPGSGSGPKCWPLANFAALAVSLREQGRQVAFLLGETEAVRRGSIAAAVPDGIELIDGLDVIQLAGRIATAAVFVGNDSGPTHLAAALQVPTVAIFGPTDPRVWAPVGEHVRVVGAPTAGPPAATVDEVLVAVAVLA